MARYVALLRGVNVGGVRISMSDLRDAVESCGHAGVATYVQSGNVVLTAAGRRSAPRLAADIRAAIAEHAGIDPPVIVLSASEWDGIVAVNPYPEETDGTKLHAVIAQQPFSTEQREAAELVCAAVRAAGSSDDLTVVGQTMYLHLPEGMGRSKLAEKLARSKSGGGQDVTARNWRTVLALQGMLRG